jgi:hypothetical protein
MSSGTLIRNKNSWKELPTNPSVIFRFYGVNISSIDADARYENPRLLDPAWQVLEIDTYKIVITINSGSVQLTWMRWYFTADLPHDVKGVSLPQCRQESVLTCPGCMEVRVWEKFSCQ